MILKAARMDARQEAHGRMLGSFQLIECGEVMSEFVEEARMAGVLGIEPRNAGIKIL